MDIESDGSERWEDFFGSSTEIGLGFLDTLANNFSEEARQLVASSSESSSGGNGCSTRSAPSVSAGHVRAFPGPEDAALRPLLDVHDIPAAVVPTQQEPAARAAVTSPQHAPPCVQSSSSVRASVRKRSDRFLSFVSANVQRMVSHTTDPSPSPTAGTTPFPLPTSCPASPVAGASSVVLPVQPTANSGPPFTVSPKTKPTESLTPSLGGTAHKRQQFPLSKGITKMFTSAGHVEAAAAAAADEQCAAAGPDRRLQPSKQKPARGLRERLVESRSTCETTANCTIDAMLMAAELARSCPEANGHAVEEAGPTTLSHDAEPLQNVATLQKKIHLLTVSLEEEEEGVAEVSERRSTAGSKVASSSRESAREEEYASQASCEDDANDHGREGGSAVVQLRGGAGRPLRKQAAEMAEDAFVKNCIDSPDQRRTIVEAINPHAHVPAPALAEANVAKLSPPKKTERKHKRKTSQLSDNASHSTSSTSTPSLDTTNSGSVYSSKVSLMQPPSTPALSSRPLSASSICSFSSSSSSSGSEHHLMGGKSAPPSYQASVESLADPSEPEQTSSSAARVADGALPGSGGSSLLIGMTMCERAVREIIDSESSYVKDLGQVIRGYLEDWKERACLKSDQLDVLFSNIQQIYDFNFKLLNRLREARGDPVLISNCFIDLHVEFSCYTKYCTSYPEAISLLTTLLQATHTNALLVSTQKLLKHTLPLGSYLLKPVQRILKYHLLLENLRKHCSDQQVALAYELMKKVAQNIDQMKKKLDQQRLVKELAGILDGWLGPDLSVLGDLLREGHLTEHTKPRIVLLFQSMLIIAKPKEDKRLQFRVYIPCKNLMLVEHLPGEPASFHVIPFDDPKGVLKLTARNREEKRQWTQQIKQAMLQHFSDIPPRAMELVLQLGDEDQRFTDKPYWTKRPTNNSAVPEYLERRQQFRRSEIRMRSKRNLLKKDIPVATSKFYSSDLESADADADSIAAAPAAVPSTPEPPSDRRPVHVCASEDCKCGSVKKQLQSEFQNRTDTPLLTSSAPSSFNRSRSESGQREDEQERLKKSLQERRKLSVPVKKQSKVRDESMDEIRTYSSTMVPKRISEIRKRRPKTSSNASATFYTNLDAQPDAQPDADGELCSSTEQVSIATELSDENVCSRSLELPESSSIVADDVVKPNLRASSCEATSEATASGRGGGAQLRDSDIISKLILDKDQFAKVTSKPLAKKKSFDSSTCTRPILNPPEPPSTEPPCEDADEQRAVTGDGAAEERRQRGHREDEQRDRTTSGEAADDEEPIYESLLRNVHVPYKYAPASLARHSLPCTGKKTKSYSHPQSPPPPPPPPPSTAPGARMVAAAPALLRKTRPESDYVTLAYSELGLLERIESGAEDEAGGGAQVRCFGLPHVSPVHARTPQMLRNSDTNISYHRDNSVVAPVAFDALDAAKEMVTTVPTPAAELSSVSGVASPGTARTSPSSKQAFLERQGSLNMKTSASQKSILQRFISLHRPAFSSRLLGSESNLLAGDPGQPLQRKLSEPNGGYAGSAGPIYKLGSMDLGCRIAHLDYADPKTLFTGQPSVSSSMHSVVSSNEYSSHVLINQESLEGAGPHPPPPFHDQRDSVLASSSSSDSVCDDDQPKPGASEEANDEDSFYERSVEECLEHDFRDSAVYSGDDNDRRVDRYIVDCGADEQQNLYETVPTISTTTTSSSTTTRVDYAARPGQEIKRRSNVGPPPPIPVKPAHLSRTKRFSNNGGCPATHVSTPLQAYSRGWVLEKVKQFQ